MSIDWRQAGLVTNPETYRPQQNLSPGISSSTSDKQYVGDDNDLPLESYEQCKHLDKNFNSEEHPTVSHKCQYQDIYGRCTRDNCVYDSNETAKIAHKHWTECIICKNIITLPPNMANIPICDKCLGRLQFAEKIPFTCLICGGSQGRPSKAPFSQICDNCFKNFLSCDNCKHWLQVSKSPAGGYDRL